MSRSSAIEVTGEKAIMLSAWGPTATKAFKKLGPLIDKYLEEDWLLQGINVYNDFENGKDINLTATISCWK
jgi:hypothetical protein